MVDIVSDVLVECIFNRLVAERILGISSHQDSSNLLQHIVDECHLRGVLIMSKCEPELLVSKIVKVVHNQWVLVALVNWHVDDSALSVALYHLLDPVDALHVHMHTLYLLAHHLAQDVE